MNTSAQSDASYFLEARDIVKTFDGVTALAGVSLKVKSGEVLCLAGENGCGKSTLIKVISGVLSPDSGQIVVEGHSYSKLTPLEVMELGIQVIYQDFSLFPNLSVAENIVVTRSVSKRRKIFNRSSARARAKEVIDSLKVHLDLDAEVESLSVADRQLTAICRALCSDARLLIMDEPTTALTQREVKRLFAVVENLRSQGVALVFVSHKLDEVTQIASRISIMRSGANVVESAVEDFDNEKIAEYMTGKTLDVSRHVVTPKEGEPMLRVRGLSSPGRLADISFDVRAGEIVGFTGLLGSGRSEIAEALFGILPHDSGEISVEGKPVKITSIQDSLKAQIGYVPEDRLTEGLFLDKPISDNMIAASIDRHTSKTGTLQKKDIRETIGQYFKSLKIKAPNVAAPVRSLSGGNAQRVVVAKWLAREPKVLILNGPTVGVDVGSKAEILQILREQAENGIAIIIISDDAPELVACCNRVFITTAGRISSELVGDEVTVETIRERVVA
ncbi:sugar ABC transporter ATP-binding protein [Actinotignum sp. GS-2025f]|uniref:sugar ABC transporter ATP-binding protein n=1 Tax=unclassified Actinotignum TaxID=2632702 RepID=UPI002A7ED3F2|nr:sugar ABC transporter ATP-binding protein [Actinotignum sp. SLA_B059]MDY5127833.1 sugar ABC transporter ATP-binding protein [Actinotignum sp. SLA_B059]